MTMTLDSHTICAMICATIMIFSTSACREVVSDPGTDSLNFIDNQSSYVLTYQLADPVIQIPIGVETQITSESALGTSGLLPEWVFDNYADQEGKDIFLYRDSNGVAIEALQLNANDELIWIETGPGELGQPNVFHYTLSITDEMIQ